MCAVSYDQHVELSHGLGVQHVYVWMRRPCEDVVQAHLLAYLPPLGTISECDKFTSSMLTYVEQCGSTCVRHLHGFSPDPWASIS
jgi:hypothetical protein